MDALEAFETQARVGAADRTEAERRAAQRAVARGFQIIAVRGPGGFSWCEQRRENLAVQCETTWLIPRLA